MSDAEDSAAKDAAERLAWPYLECTCSKCNTVQTITYQTGETRKSLELTAWLMSKNPSGCCQAEVTIKVCNAPDDPEYLDVMTLPHHGRFTVEVGGKVLGVVDLDLDAPEEK